MKIAILSPFYGPPAEARCSLGYANALIALARDPSIEIVGRIQTDCDIIRARSRIVREFRATKADYGLWWDEDVVAPVEQIGKCINGMLATKQDFIAAPYPRKRLHWHSGVTEATAVKYPISALGPTRIDPETVSVPVAHVGFGFVLMSRACADRMWAAYEETLSYLDVCGDKSAPGVALFQLVIDPTTRLLLSEDYSFCHRWRAIGGEVHLYVGPGAPLDHLGSHLFKGHRAGLVGG